MTQPNLYLQSFQIRIDQIDFTLTKDSTFEFDFYEEEPFNIHNHPCYELFFNFGDSFYIQTKTERFSFSADSLVVIPPSVFHYAGGDGGNKECYRFLLQFSTKAAEKNNPLFKLYTALFSCEDIRSYPIGDKDLAVYFKELLSCFRHERISGQTRIRSLFTLILLKIADFAKLESLSPNNIPADAGNYFFEISRFVDDKYMENIKVKDVAREINLCGRHTSRLILKYYGKTFSQLLVDKRLSVAALLLIKTNHSVNRIISEINFHSESSFYTLFKKHYRLSPLQYRKQFAV